MQGKFFGIESLLESIIERIKSIAQGSYTVGEAIKQEEKTILPINTISFGLAGAGGDSWGKGSSELSQTVGEGNMGFGGVGGGVRVETRGFLVVNGEDIKVLPVPTRSIFDGFFDKLPEMVDQVTSRLPDASGRRVAELEAALKEKDAELLQLAGKKPEKK
ncbi:MAG: spore germination protein GerW family protein [Bdellovibrionota bacterium]